MKQKGFLLLSLTVALFIVISSCKEVPPGINFNPTTEGPDTIDINTQKRNVLIEEATGVRCVNCPAAHQLADNIAAAHPGRVSQVSIHVGNYAIKYPYSKYEFKIQAGVDLNSLIGPSSQWPSAAINRVLFPGLLNKFISPPTNWAGYVDNELSDTLPKVKIGLTPTYNSGTRELNLGVKLYYMEDVSTANNLSVMITENGIIDPQEIPTSIKPSGIDTFYVHRHVLRGMMTPSAGQVINGTKTPGAHLSVNIAPFTLPAEWNADSCRIIAFVTAGTDSVLQVVETPVRK